MWADFDIDRPRKRIARYISVYGGERRWEIVTENEVTGAKDGLATVVVPEGASRAQYLKKALELSGGDLPSDMEIGTIAGYILGVMQPPQMVKETVGR